LYAIPANALIIPVDRDAVDWKMGAKFSTLGLQEYTKLVVRPAVLNKHGIYPLSSYESGFPMPAMLSE
jgi:hypothetical protein